MKPVSIHFNENGFNDHAAAFEPNITALNEVLNTYHSLGLQPLNEAEFKQLFSFFEAIMFDKMTEGKPIVIGGFEIDKIKAIDMLAKPKGYVQLGAFVIEYKKMPQAMQILNNVVLNGNEVCLSESFLEKAQRRFEIWATIDNAIKAYEFTRKVMDAATKVFGKDEINIPATVAGMINYQSVLLGGVANGFKDEYKNLINAEGITSFRAYN